MLFTEEELAPYQGTEPYVFFSFSPENAAAAAEIIQKLKGEGYRVWYDNGQIDGAERDERIAQKIVRSGYVFSLLSEAYLRSVACRDELSFARMREKPQLILYLEDIEMPLGMSMRLGRLFAVHRSEYPGERFYEKIFSADGLNACRGLRPQEIAADEDAEHSPEEDAALRFEQLHCLMPGDTFFFGRFRTEADGGIAAISWLVLENKNLRLLALSKLVLDCRQYHTENGEVSWETCSLRAWLNESFLNTSFNEEEQALLLPVSVQAEANPIYKTAPGNSTRDRIFLLSYRELPYGVTDCRATPYALEQAFRMHRRNHIPKNGSCHWWLRTPGKDASRAMLVGDGDPTSSGASACLDSAGVRPALWLDLRSLL